MKNSNITGWKDVFSFTLIQTLKNKAFVISYLIMLTMAIISMPLINMLTSKGKIDPDAPSPVNKVYVENTTTLPDMDFTQLLQNKAFSHIKFEKMQEEYDTVADRIEKGENTSVILTLSEKDGIYSLDFVKASKGPVRDNSLTSLGNAVLEQFDTFRINTLGITQEQNAILNAKVDSKVTLADVNGNEIVKKNTSISNGEYWFIYGILFVVLMVNVMASSQIATSIVTEKSTRVIEYLLTSVKPLALMVGKIIAMLTAVLTEMVSLVLVVFISNTVSARLASGGSKSVLSQYLPSNIFENLNLPNIILCIVLVLLGMIFYATLAGLAGATVSRIEDIQEGLTLFTFTNMIGAYIGIAAANILMGPGENSFVTFAFLFPLSSPFVLPGSILIGKVDLPMIAAAIVLQLVFIALLFRFVSKIFETLILHNGNTIKPKELFKLSKSL